MKGDFTRSTFVPKKRYSGVRMQQGRVQLDTDWNEQFDIQAYLSQAEAKDVIGFCGVPKTGGGFKINILADESDFTISAGHIYVEGILCELEAPAVAVTDLTTDTVVFSAGVMDSLEVKKDQWIEIFADGLDARPVQIKNIQLDQFVLTFAPELIQSELDTYRSAQGLKIRRLTTYLTQDDYPNAPLPIDPAVYLVYLDVWQQDISALEDNDIREVALGGPDTATRTKTVWQVKCCKAGDIGEPIQCTSTPDAWKTLTLPKSGRLRARARKKDSSTDPCILSPNAEYRRLGNQLYRVEIHDEGILAGKATFKWSRDNGCVAARLDDISADGSAITISHPNNHGLKGFADAPWIELSDEGRTLRGEPGVLLEVTAVQGNRLMVTGWPGGGPLSRSDFGSQPVVRRWDGGGPLLVEVPADNEGYLPLESGIEIKFEEGLYRSGDYWQIPARTATGDVEWPRDGSKQSIAKTPDGIKHHYARLAILQFSNKFIMGTVQDCREIFRPLTEIKEIEDPEEYHRKHNRYLHGSGVVCGLKVRCARDRKHVRVEKGYALDCEGYDLFLEKERTIDVVTQARSRNLLDGRTGKGGVALTIRRGANRDVVIEVEPYVSQGFWEAVLEGTLLKAFFKECIGSVMHILKNQFLPFPDDTVPVSLKHRRVISFINLLWQLINSDSGRYVFLSVAEDKLLRESYQALRDILASETFCAQYDKVRPFPDYPYSDPPPGIDTLFGLLKFHKRLRLHPTYSLAYTFGTGNTISIYNLEKKEMVRSLVFPGGPNIDVQDIAFSEKGNELYAVGIDDANSSSVFATATIDANQAHSWGRTTVVCNIKFVTLATHSKWPNRLLAIAKAIGLYMFENPSNISLPLNPLVGFNATGLLALSEDGQFAIAAASSGTTETSDFDGLQFIRLQGPQTEFIEEIIKGNDMANDLMVHGEEVFVTGVDPTTGYPKSLCAFKYAPGVRGDRSRDPLNLKDRGMTRLAVLPKTGYLLISFSDRFKIGRVDIQQQWKLEEIFRIPVQLYPLDMSVRSNQEEIYVLNTLSNTLNGISAAAVFSVSPPPSFTNEPPLTLSNYRQQIMDAFEDILHLALQYLKDCFCEKFLVDCPSCVPKDKVYLGRVEIEDDKVFNICNFSKRHYVKSVETVEYWLSTIPILPLIKRAFTSLCCKVFQ